MRGEKVKSCLVINGGRKFNKWQTKAFIKYFKEVDFVQSKITPEVWPNKFYDLVVVNWGL